MKNKKQKEEIIMRRQVMYNPFVGERARYVAHYMSLCYNWNFEHSDIYKPYDGGSVMIL